MKQLLAIAFITLLALGTGCAWISPAAETASDGIQVHGHWTVTVTNPDGTVDAVHEFDNSLVSKEALSALILGETSLDHNSLLIQFSTYYTSEQLPVGDAKLHCQEELDEYAGVDSAGPYVRIPATWSRDLKTSGTPIMITGSCTVIPFTQDNTITMVKTKFSTQTSYNNSFGSQSEGGVFTQKFFGSQEEITVENGQTLGFNIRVSFE